MFLPVRGMMYYKQALELQCFLESAGDYGLCFLPQIKLQFRITIFGSSVSVWFKVNTMACQNKLLRNYACSKFWWLSDHGIQSGK